MFGFAVGVVVWAVGGAVGASVSGSVLGGCVAAAVAAGVWYWGSHPVVLAVNRARPADERLCARLHNQVEGLCVAAGLPKPGVYVVDDAGCNAFSAGRDPAHASVVVTSGLLAAVKPVELEAVLAHELSHVKSHDVAVSTLASTTAGLVVLLTDWVARLVPGRGDGRGGRGAADAIVGAVLALAGRPSAYLLRATVGSDREPVADASAVSVTRYPPALAAALEKLTDGAAVVSDAPRATAHLWLACPLATGPDDPHARTNRLFVSQPPLQGRIDALREL